MKLFKCLLIVICLGSVLPSGCNRFNPREVYDTVVQPDNIAQIKEQLLKSHNYARGSVGELKVSPVLDKYAQEWAESMASRNRMTHGNFIDRVQWSGGTTGENIAKGTINVDQVMRMWMDSSGHRHNIMKEDFKFVGFGVAISSNGVVYWCTDFGG